MDSPSAHPPANPPLPPTHICSTWCMTQGLLSPSTLPKWGEPPVGDPRGPHLSLQTAGRVGTLVARPGLGPGCRHDTRKSGGGGGVGNRSVECLDGVCGGCAPLTLRRMCGVGQEERDCLGPRCGTRRLL